MTKLPGPHHPPDSAREPVGKIVALGATRALALLLGVAALETVVRTTMGAASFPGATDAVLELVTRTSRLLFLAPGVIAYDLTLAALGQSGPVGRWLGPRARRALWILAAPRVVLRAALVYAAGTVVLARTAGLEYQLSWHAGALFALATLPVHAAVELVCARAKPEPSPDRAHRAGLLVWLTATGVGCCLLAGPFASRIAAPALALGVMGAMLHGFWTFDRFALRVFAGLCLFVLSGLWLDRSDPALRRFASSYAPFSALALASLQEVTDFDGDGASGLFGLDCDDLDPTRSPTLADVPDDGIDQNCTGSDASLEASMAAVGPKSPRARRSPVRSRAKHPSVFLLTVDGLRADVFESGAALPETRAWADGCYRFTNAYSNANGTGQSLLSLHTGMHARHVLEGNLWRIALADPKHKLLSTPPTLASALTRAGFATYVVFPPFHVDNFSFLTGFELGGTLPPTGDGHYPRLEAALERADEHLKENATSRPMHLRVHLMDLHVPYREGPGFAGYLRSARAIDARLASFIRALPADSIVILSADHGEAFGEHGAYTHGHTLFDEEVRVPLVICAPPSFDLGPPRALGNLVGLVDLTPTIIDLLGLDVSYPWHGQSLVPLLRDGTAPPRSWVLLESWANPGYMQAIVDGCQKWIQDFDSGWEARFDRCVDPAERHDTRKRAGSTTRTLLGTVVDTELDAFRSWRVGMTRTMDQ
ncbi:MAG: sulfatase-like hydrolase/transferase [Myxococcales bacterium]|nr:sulfatase-like hydrolase/transferase [Myxococcales bacterium]